VQPDVFVVPIAGTRRDGTPHADTDVREFRDPTGEYRDRWDLLDPDGPVPEPATSSNRQPAVWIPHGGLLFRGVVAYSQRSNRPSGFVERDSGRGRRR
jgi:hypothetical protein